MTEQPASVARFVAIDFPVCTTYSSEAKSIHQSLKELLKTKEPFDKEVDFQRKNLRRRYLNLLLLHTSTKESKDVENHLWMQTSYAFISAYKQRIAALDRTIQNNQRNEQQQGDGASRPRSGNHGVVEHRKLVQRFRQFLADEEKFWTQLVLRLRRLFGLGEGQTALQKLGVNIEELNAAPEAAENGRNHFQFPPEDTTKKFVPETEQERKACLSILSKALICLGDIARYRELYNDGNGKRVQEDGRRGRNRRGDMPPRPKNYEKAQACYEEARLLVPDEGNPSHQLAILASYKKDSFASLVHYYRALCATQKYETAAENLGIVLHKALEAWRHKSRRERDRKAANDAQPTVRVQIETFQENVVVLHALWRVALNKGIDKMRSIAPKQSEKVSKAFRYLVSERHLPDEMISQTIVLSQGALWKHRMIRPSSTPQNSQGNPPPAGTPIMVEWALVSHLLDLHMALLEVGKDELRDPPAMEGSDDLAQRISAVFRRTLPALRIASKWLRANFKFMMQDPEFKAYQAREANKGSDVTKRDEHKLSVHSKKTVMFWKTYAQFVLALSQAFPAARLPPFSPLDEDRDMRGFWPLRQLMDGTRDRVEDHPNVEQLMRITDLLEDAKLLAAMEHSPLVVINNHTMFNTSIVEDTSAPKTDVVDDASSTVLEIEKVTEPERDIDAMTDITSRTDDELVHAAFEHLKNSPENIEDDEEDEEIVWPRASPSLSPNFQATPVTPLKSMLSPTAQSPTSPTYPRPPMATTLGTPAAPAATTAQDLLNDVLNGFPTATRTNSGNLLPTIDSISTAPQPQLLFGSDGPRQSIWSASQDETPLFGNVSSSQIAGQAYSTSPRQFMGGLPPPQSISSSTWGSPFQGPLQNSHPNLPPAGITSATSFSQAQPMMPISNNVIQRPQAHLQPQQLRQQQLPLDQSPQQRFPPPGPPGPSAGLFSSQILNQRSNMQDPFIFSSPVQQQQPIRRPEQQNMFLSPGSGYPNMSQQSFNVIGSQRGSLSPQYFGDSPIAAAQGYPGGHLSMHDPRLSQNNFMSPPMSQIWGNTG